ALIEPAGAALYLRVGEAFRLRFGEHRIHPRAGMDAVGDGGDRHLPLLEPSPELVEHPAGDLAVELRYSVRVFGHPQTHHRHVEHARIAALVVLGAEGKDRIDVDSRHLRGAGEVVTHEGDVETVDPRRHGRVGSEHRTGTHCFDRGRQTRTV